MRAFIRWSQSNQGCLLLTLGVTAYYLLIYRPIHARALDLDIPLEQAWSQLEGANQRTLTQDRLDLDQISRGLRQLEKNFTGTTNANQRLLSRVRINPDYTARAQNPFQLIDFQNERQITIEALNRAANQRSIAIATDVFDGFPQYLSNQTDPEYLWHELALTRHLIESMVFAEISEIQSLATQRQRIPLTLNDSEYEGAPLPPFVAELDYTCTSAQLAKLILMLPSRSPEIQEQLNLDYPANKPSLYVDQILIRKTAPLEPTKVTVWMKVIGFILPPNPVPSERAN